jgi:hypothetical protein
MTKAEIIAKLSDRDVVALTLWREAKPTTAGRVSVALVMSARVRDGRYGTGYRGVCLKPWAFSCWKPEGGLSNHERLIAAAERIVTGDPTVWKQDVGLRECAEIADALIVASNATHYLTRALYDTKPPAWAKQKAPAGELAGHLFFEKVDD